MHIDFLLVKSLHEKQQRKERLWGTDLGIRTLSKELEVPSNPHLPTIPRLPLPMHCSTGFAHKGAERRHPRAHPKRGKALLPPTPICTEHWQHLRELLNIQKLHKINTTIRELLNAQRPHLLQKSPSCRGWEAMCPVPDLFLRHSPFGHDQLLPCIKSNALTGFNTVQTVL